MEWLKDMIGRCPEDLIGVVIISAFAIYTLYRIIVWSFKIIEKFSESETETAKTLSQLKTIVETLIILERRGDD